MKIIKNITTICMLFVCQALAAGLQKELECFLHAHSTLNDFMHKDLAKDLEVYITNVGESVRDENVFLFRLACQQKQSEPVNLEFALKDFDSWTRYIDEPSTLRKFLYLSSKLSDRLLSLEKVINDHLQDSCSLQILQTAVEPYRRSLLYDEEWMQSFLSRSVMITHSPLESSREF
ncbi:MAG: hypothetical protein OXC30_05360 [Alphaproteobacteria bacterium]|nr:hypothetical protein [Alphaproteobacteria bacterium]